jgi:hypothetical protein
MAKATKTPVLESITGTDDATDRLASGADLAKVAEAVQQATAGDASTETPAPTPAAGDASTEASAPIPVAQDALVAHLTAQNLEFSRLNSALQIENAMIKRDLGASQVKATENGALLSSLTKATCAAINITHIQLGKQAVDLTHLDPAAAVAMYNTVQASFLKAFKPGQRSTNLAETGDADGEGAEMAPTREEVLASQRVGKARS